MRKEQEIPADLKKHLEFSEMRNMATEIRHIISNFNSRLDTTKERSSQQRDRPQETLRNLLREMMGRGGCETGVRRCGGHRIDRVRIGAQGRSVRVGGRRHLKGQGREVSTAVQRAEPSNREAQGVLSSPRKDQSTPDTLW